MVVDGRKPGIAIGMNYEELAAEMIRLGCRDALNLDGGGSSVMAVRDAATGGMKILNAPTDGRERAVADVLGISVDQN
jgi:exopolysaccharide biosynthesis protein